jgi:hypothetical protein
MEVISMSLLLTMLIIASILLVLVFVVALRIIFTFNSDNADMHLTLLWLYPFLKAVVTNEDTDMVLTVYLFKKSIIKKTLRKRETKEAANNMDIIRQVHPRDINVHAAYGFKDPFVTGVACGAINIASQFINIDSIQQDPDFVTDEDYFSINATAKVNLGSALVNLYRARNEDSEE